MNLKAFIPTYHPSSSVDMTNKTPSSREKHHKSTKPGNSETAKTFFFFFFLSLFLQMG